MPSSSCDTFDGQTVGGGYKDGMWCVCDGGKEGKGTIESSIMIKQCKYTLIHDCL